VSLFTAVWASVARQERTTGRAIAPAQALSRLQALQTVTRNGAFLSFEEDRKGTLAPGHWADIAVLTPTRWPCRWTNSPTSTRS
jgi:predicted amidohydrolase YtcJ